MGLRYYQPHGDVDQCNVVIVNAELVRAAAPAIVRVVTRSRGSAMSKHDIDIADVAAVARLGGLQADTSPAKNYAVEIPSKGYSPGITALQGLAQCTEPAPPGVTSRHDHWQAPAR